MRRPRFRLTVRRMMALVAGCAVVLLVVREFGDGLPPRFVIRAMPGRVARLKPGMNGPETRAILGLDKSWIWGGTGPLTNGEITEAHMTHIDVDLRELKLDVKANLWRPSSQLKLTFSNPGDANWKFDETTGSLTWSLKTGPPSGNGTWKIDETTRLQSASFVLDGRTVAEMPSKP